MKSKNIPGQSLIMSRSILIDLLGSNRSIDSHCQHNVDVTTSTRNDKPISTLFQRNTDLEIREPRHLNV